MIPSVFKSRELLVVATSTKAVSEVATQADFMDKLTDHESELSSKKKVRANLVRKQSKEISIYYG